MIEPAAIGTVVAPAPEGYHHSFEVRIRTRRPKIE